MSFKADTGRMNCTSRFTRHRAQMHYVKITKQIHSFSLCKILEKRNNSAILENLCSGKVRWKNHFCSLE